MNRYAYKTTIPKPSAETATVGIQKNKALKMGRPRLTEKNNANDKTAKIQNLGETMLVTNTAIPVAFDPLRSGQRNANSAMKIAANPLSMPLK